MEYQFKIKMKDITKPPVWRRLVVPADFTFERFHHVIQTAFGWENCHLYSFQNKIYHPDLRIKISFDDDLDLVFGCIELDASTIRLSEIFAKEFSQFLYVYDFGDYWVHEITLEETSDNGQKVAICLDGKGSCPPEDCGGPYGYKGMKEVFRTMPDSEEADNYRDWLGLEDDEEWDAAYFDIDEVNEALKEA